MRTNVRTIANLILAACLFVSSAVAGEEEAPLETIYIEIDPIIVTNFLRAKGKKPGFVQLQATISVAGKEASDTVEKHLPLIRDTIIDFLSFTEEAVIKDISKRQEIRNSLTEQVNSRLEEVLGQPYATQLVITHFMWG